MSPLSAVLLVSGYRSSLEQERGRAEKLLRLGPAGELSGHRASSQFSVRHQTANRWAAATFLVLVLFGSFLRLKMFNLWPSWEDFYTAPHLYDGF